MFSWLANAWRVPELRKRVLFTALILALYRLGSWVPAPGVNSDAIQGYFNSQGGGHQEAVDAAREQLAESTDEGEKALHQSDSSSPGRGISAGAEVSRVGARPSR